MDEERLKILLYNAIVWIDEEQSDYFVSCVGNEYEWFEKALGIRKQELQELGVDWIKEASKEESKSKE